MKLQICLFRSCVLSFSFLSTCLNTAFMGGFLWAREVRPFANELLFHCSFVCSGVNLNSGFLAVCKLLLVLHTFVV